MIQTTNITPLAGIYLVIDRYQKAIEKILPTFKNYGRVFVVKDTFSHYLDNGDYECIQYSDGNPRTFFEIQKQVSLGNMYQTELIFHIVGETQFSIYPIVYALQTARQYTKGTISNCTPSNINNKLLLPKIHQTIKIVIKHAISDINNLEIF